MSNSLKRAYLLRNICMLGSILLLFLDAAFFPHNFDHIRNGAIYAGCIFFASLRIFRIYINNVFLKKCRLDEIIDFYRWKKHCTIAGKNNHFNAMMWLGDDEGIDSYLNKNGLSLQQSISKHFYDIDRRLFYLGEDADYSLEIDRLKNMVSMCSSMPVRYKSFSIKFNNYLQFYDYFIQKKYDLALYVINNIESKDQLNQSWIIFHEMMVYKAMGQEDKAGVANERLKELKCSTRFHKWLGIKGQKQKTQVFLPLWLLLLALVICLDLAISKGTQSYSVQEDALEEEYNISVEDYEILYDNGDGIRIYAKGRDIIYILYAGNDEGGFVVKEFYEDTLLTPDTDYLAFAATSRLKSVSILFYDRISVLNNRVIVTESDELDNRLLAGFEVLSIESRTIQNETYYLVHVR